MWVDLVVCLEPTREYFAYCILIKNKVLRSSLSSCKIEVNFQCYWVCRHH